MIDVGLLTLGILPILVLGMGLIGSSLRYALGQLWPSVRGVPPEDWTDVFVRAIEDVALGLATVPILFVLTSTAGIPLGAPVAFALLGIGVAAVVVRAVFDRTSLGVPFTRAPARGRLGLLAVAAVLAVVILTRVVPYDSLLVYAGNDIRMYTLITQLVQAHGGFVDSWGSFSGPTWNVVIDNHLTFAGSEAVFSIVAWWVPISVPQLTSATTIALNILIPFGAYVFLRRLFPDRDASLPVLGALIFGAVAAYPLYFLQWGGIDETAGWFLFPIALSFLLGYLKEPGRNSGALLLGGWVLGGAVIANPISAFYVVSFLIALLITGFLFRDEIVRGIRAVGIFLAIGLALVSPLAYTIARRWQSSLAALPPGSEGWEGFQNAVILRPGDWVGSIGRFFELNTGLAPVLFVTIGGLAGLALYAYRDRIAATLLLWVLALLLLNTNGPFGLFFIQYPLWSVPYPDRVAEVMFLPLSIGTALVLSGLWVRGRTVFVRPEFHPSAPEVRAPIRPRPRPSRAAVTALAVFVILAVLGGTAAGEINQSNVGTVLWGSSLTSQDLAGFQWIEGHVPSNATILVTSADSGTWIPEFTGVRVFPYPELINNPSVVNVSNYVPGFFNSTNYAPTMGFLREFNTSYVYFGERTQYDILRGLNVPMFVDPTPITPFVRESSSCGASTNISWLWLTCNNDSATFEGPVVLSLTELLNGSVLGVAHVAIPAGYAWTFDLRSGTPQWPGNWAVHFSESPIGSTAFEDDKVCIVRLDPFFLRLVSDPARVLNETISGRVPQL